MKKICLILGLILFLVQFSLTAQESKKVQSPESIKSGGYLIVPLQRCAFILFKDTRNLEEFWDSDKMALEKQGYRFYPSLPSAALAVSKKGSKANLGKYVFQSKVIKVGSVYLFKYLPKKPYPLIIKFIDNQIRFSPKIRLDAKVVKSKLNRFIKGQKQLKGLDVFYKPTVVPGADHFIVIKNKSTSKPSYSLSEIIIKTAIKLGGEDWIVRAEPKSNAFILGGDQRKYILGEDK